MAKGCQANEERQEELQSFGTSIRAVSLLGCRGLVCRTGMSMEG